MYVTKACRACMRVCRFSLAQRRYKFRAERQIRLVQCVTQCGDIDQISAATQHQIRPVQRLRLVHKLESCDNLIYVAALQPNLLRRVTGREDAALANLIYTQMYLSIGKAQHRRALTLLRPTLLLCFLLYLSSSHTLLPSLLLLCLSRLSRDTHTQQHHDTHRV